MSELHIYVPTILEEKNMSNKQGNPSCDHKIEAGDTYSNLAASYYGDGSDANAKKIKMQILGVALRICKLVRRLGFLKSINVMLA